MVARKVISMVSSILSNNWGRYAQSGSTNICPAKAAILPSEPRRRTTSTSTSGAVSHIAPSTAHNDATSGSGGKPLGVGQRQIETVVRNVRMR